MRATRDWRSVEQQHSANLQNLELQRSLSAMLQKSTGEGGIRGSRRGGGRHSGSCPSGVSRFHLHLLLLLLVLLPGGFPQPSPQPPPPPEACPPRSTGSTGGTGLSLYWIREQGEDDSGVSCVAGLCRRYAHFIYAIAPSASTASTSDDSSSGSSAASSSFRSVASVTPPGHHHAAQRTETSAFLRRPLVVGAFVWTDEGGAEHARWRPAVTAQTIDQAHIIEGNMVHYITFMRCVVCGIGCL